MGLWGLISYTDDCERILCSATSLDLAGGSEVSTVFAMCSMWPPMTLILACDMQRSRCPSPIATHKQRLRLHVTHYCCVEVVTGEQPEGHNTADPWVSKLQTLFVHKDGLHLSYSCPKERKCWSQSWRHPE